MWMNPEKALNFESLPPAVLQRIEELRPLSNGPRTMAEWEAYKKRQRSFDANAAIENMALDADQMNMLDICFSLNLPDEQSHSLFMMWLHSTLACGPETGLAAE